MTNNYFGLDKILDKKDLEKAFLRELGAAGKKAPHLKKRVKQIAEYVHIAYRIGLKAGMDGEDAEPQPDLLKDLNVEAPSEELEQICGYVYETYKVGYEIGTGLRGRDSK